MRTFVTSAGALVLGLAVVATAAAGGPKGGGGFSGSKSISSNGMGNGTYHPPTLNALSFKPSQITTHGANGFTPTKFTTLKPTFTGKDYNLKFGTKCDFGFCYKGFQQCHWSYCCWWAPCGCNCYWDPCVLCYYYYCTPDGCWYPISHCTYGTYSWN